MKPFNLHSPVNQSIIFQIFPKQNILNLRGLPLVEIRVSYIGEDGSTDSTARGKKKKYSILQKTQKPKSKMISHDPAETTGLLVSSLYPK